MKNLLQIYFGFLLLSLFLMNLGCVGDEPEGCTDPNALNYYAGAVVNDGSCLYVGSKFTGDYTGSFLCGDALPMLNTDSISIWIFIHTDYPNDIQISISHNPISLFVGTVTGDNFNINFTGFSSIFDPIDIDMDGDIDIFDYHVTGSGTVSGNILTINITLELSSPNLTSEFIDQCTLTATKI